jgi:hypothetical protein
MVMKNDAASKTILEEENLKDLDNTSQKSGESFDSQFSEGFQPEQKALEKEAKALKADM